MTTESTNQGRMTLIYEPPGPGSWERDPDHQATPRGALMNDLFCDGFEQGFASTFSRYGLPLETMQARFIHGWVYVRARIAGAPDKGGAPPPNFVLKLITRVHPEMRRRNKTAKQALENRLWLLDTRTWNAERQSWINRCDQLLACEPTELDDPALLKHVDGATRLAGEMIRRHFELIGPTAAVGRLIVAAEQWGVATTDVMRLLRGASPASAATLGPLREIATLVRASGRTPATTDELKAVSKEVADLVDRYFGRFGWQLLDDDVTFPTLAEHPDTLVTMVDAAGRDMTPAAATEEVTEIRLSVPEADRLHFDQLLDEARIAYASLDDNSGVTALTGGVARRAMLAVAWRAVGDGRLAHERDVWNLHMNELREMAGGAAGPGHDELRARRDLLLAAAASSPPNVVGDAPSPPPDPSVFPAPMREVTTAMLTYIMHKFTRQEPPDGGSGFGALTIGPDQVAVGQAVGSGAATGRIRVCTEASDALARLEPGDILVCRFTSPGWNSIFPMLGGIVAATGGPLGHTAVMAREFDLPAIVGVGSIHPSWDDQHGHIAMT